MRVAIYARYSSDSQRDASIEDQVRLCVERVSKEGWTTIGTYTDHAVSGATLLRPGIQALIQDVVAGKIDIILCEALDRLSRDQEDIAGLFKRAQFAEVKIITLSEGEIGNLHIGLKGTMNAMFLKDLADKTRRGLRGRVEKGKAGGGITYGYDVVKRIDQNGEYARGERAINPEEAAIVRRIFEGYSQGISPRALSHQLNKEGVPSPMAKGQRGGWGASTIYGNRERGTGILNNELYIGKLVWNRLRYLKDPETGKRISRLNDPSEVITNDVPDPRIIDQALWDKVKTIQGEINRSEIPLWKKNRPKNLLTGLMKCGCCGGGVIVVSSTNVGCAAAKDKGTCDNRLTMRRDVLEQKVLAAMQTHLMDERLCEEFCAEYTRETNRLRMQRNASLNGYRAEEAKLERERQQIIKSIADGVPTELIRDRAVYVQKRREEVAAILSSASDAPVYFHPNMANRYQIEIRNLIASLSDEQARTQAALILRSLIDKIVLTPVAGTKTLAVDLVGDLAGILSIASNRGRESIAADLLKLQPVQEASLDADGEKEKPQNSAVSLAPEVLVAGAGLGRLRTSLGNPEAQNWKTPLSRGFQESVKLVAGTRLRRPPAFAFAA